MRVKCLISCQEISVLIPIFPYTKTLSGCQLGAENRYFHAISVFHLYQSHTVLPRWCGLPCLSSNTKWNSRTMATKSSHYCLVLSRCACQSSRSPACAFWRDSISISILQAWGQRKAKSMPMVKYSKERTPSTHSFDSSNE
jgi:hypothetical protein